MSSVQPNTAPQLFDEQGNPVWAANARKLRAWYLSLWICLGVALTAFGPVGDLVGLLFSIGWLGGVVTMIGCVIYSYRIQRKLRELGFARTDPAFIVVGAVLALLPTALIAPPSVLSTAKKAARQIDAGHVTRP